MNDSVEITEEPKPIGPVEAAEPEPIKEPTPRHWIEVLDDGRIVTYNRVPADAEPLALHGGKLHEVGRPVDVQSTMLAEGKLQPIGPAPSPKHAFDYALRAWVDSRDLAWWKAWQWATIKSQRDAIEFGPFSYRGHVFDGDRDAQRRLTYCVTVSRQALATGSRFETHFVLANDSAVLLLATDFIAIEHAKGSQVLAAFATAIALRKRIEAATTIVDVQAVVWPEPADVPIRNRAEARAKPPAASPPKS